ncbi:ATP synthase subunit I [Mycoplasmatota bacterium]|nr:ATP synthase subunit I [Mycoplasmatota bacterium]
MEKNNIYYKVIPIVWVYGLIVSLILYFVGKNQGVETMWTISFALGLATSLMNFSLMTKAVRNALSRPEGTRMRYLMMQQGLRYFIYIAIMLSVAFNNKFDLIFTFIGMLSVKVVMFFYILIKKGGDE